MVARSGDNRRFWSLLSVLVVAVCLAMAFGQGRTVSLARNTALLCLATCAMSLPSGAMLAFLVVRTDLPGRRVVGWLLGFLLLVPLYVQAAGWEAGFGLQGAVTLGLESGVWLEGFRAAVWVHAVAAIPWVALIVGAGLWFVEPELEEAALLDGSALQVFRAVTVPRCAAAIAVAALWVAVATAGEMTVTDLFQVRTYAEELYTETALGREPGSAGLAMLPSILLVASLATAALLMCGRLVARFNVAGGGRPHTFHLYRWRWPCALVAWSLMLLSAGVPIASLLYKAGVTVVQTESGRVRGWSIGRCAESVNRSVPAFSEDIGWTLAIGSLAATIARCLAIPLAWWARGGGWRALPTLSLISLLLAVPGPIVGLSVIWLLNRPDPQWLASWLGVPPRDGLFGMLYDHPLVAPTAVQCVRALPLTTLVCWGAFRRVPVESLEAAAVAGAGPLLRLWKVAMPQCRIALAAAWLLALVLAIGELAASVLVVPPGVTTMSIQIFNQLHYGAESPVAAICLAMLGLYGALGFVVALAAWWLARRRGVRL